MHKVWWRLILFRSHITKENDNITGRFDYLTEKDCWKMGGCCCSARKPHLHGTPVYYYCPPTLEERESLTSNDGRAMSLTTGLLVSLNLETSTPDTYQSPPAPPPYDMVLGGPASTDSESGRVTVSGSSFETLITCDDLEESDCKAKANSAPISPSKAELSKSKEFHALVTEEEDGCPICLDGP
ncbi:hypothetical protein JHK84_044398 [Glycine max]|nr:hypothetical protein JHK84_044398 [Glycine max]